MVTAGQRFAEAAARLRRAIAAGVYAQAQEALLALAKELERAVAEQDESEARRLAQEAGELLSWARRATLAGRAHDAARLARLHRLPEGYRQPRGQGPSVRLAG